MELSYDDTDSERALTSALSTLSSAGAGVIHVKTSEFFRTLHALRGAILLSGNLYYEWDIVSGTREYKLATIYTGEDPDGITNINEALRIPKRRLNDADLGDDTVTYFVYCNPHKFVTENTPVAIHMLKEYIATLPVTNIRIILVTPEVTLPEDLHEGLMTLRFRPPSHAELRSYLDTILSGVEDDEGNEGLDLSDDEKDTICQSAAGMSKVDFDTYVSVAIMDQVHALRNDVEVDWFEAIIDGVRKGKTEIVNKTDILELRNPESMSNVGGMENLKEWIKKRRLAYSEEAKAFGVEPPKGIVLVGIPGSGKSLASTAIAGELGIPLVRLDFGRVFNSLVGSSEQRVRDALRMAENMAPIVLHIDEIDKGLGGIGGSGDSGTSSRVLGTFLSWLQDNKKPVFTVVTANNITGLPPELLRRGRFDDIFSTGFPTSSERREVLKIHLKRRGWNLSDFDKADILEVVNASRGYVPSEIEQAVKDALVHAFGEGESLEMSHIANELKAMVPMHVTHNETIQAMAAWMKDNAKPASKSYESGVLDSPRGEDSNVSSINQRRKLRTTRRKKRTTDDSEG